MIPNPPKDSAPQDAIDLVKLATEIVAANAPRETTGPEAYALAMGFFDTQKRLTHETMLCDAWHKNFGVAAGKLANALAQATALRTALETHKHTDECRDYAAETHRPYCLARCNDNHGAALSATPPAVPSTTAIVEAALTWNKARYVDDLDFLAAAEQSLIDTIEAPEATKE